MSDRFGLSDTFWELVQQANGSADGLEKLLIQHSKASVRQFHRELESAYAMLSSEGVDSILRGEFNASDSEVDSILGYIILQGKEYYQHVLDHPEDVPPERHPDTDLQGVAAHAYRKRFGELIYLQEEEEQSPRMTGKVLALVIPLPGSQSREEGEAIQGEITSDLDAEGFAGRLTSSSLGPINGMTMYYLVDDEAAFRSAVEKVVKKRLPDRVFKIVESE